MRRVLLIVVIVVIVLYGVAAIHGARKLAAASSQPWPEGLGTLASVRDRFPPQSANEAARKLTSLAEPLGIPFDARVPPGPGRMPTSYERDAAAISTYVQAEAERAERTIGEPPPAAAQFVATHAAAIAAMRELLLAETVTWPRNTAAGYEAPAPNLLGHMALTRVLVTSALVRARGNDPGAWSDLQAAWNLSRSLHGHPEMIAQLVALAMARTINAAAWKMPAPVPAWRSQMDGVAHDRLLRRSLQYEKWLLSSYGIGATPSRARGIFGWGRRLVDPLSRPFVSVTIAEMIDHERETARQLASVTDCGFDGRAFYQQRMPPQLVRMAVPNLAAVWQRAFRYRAEREATRNALLLTSGAPLPASRCSDGTWIVEGTTLRFTRDIPKSSPTETAMPLTLRVGP